MLLVGGGTEPNGEEASSRQPLQDRLTVLRPNVRCPRSALFRYLLTPWTNRRRQYAMSAPRPVMTFIPPQPHSSVAPSAYRSTIWRSLGAGGMYARCACREQQIERGGLRHTEENPGLVLDQARAFRPGATAF